MEKTSDHPSKPRRPASHAKRHFESIVEDHLTKWKCKYCAMTYGEKTATSNLWRHLENKHHQNIGANDQRQSIAIRKCKFDKTDRNVECKSSNRLKLEQRRCHFLNRPPQILIAPHNDDVVETVDTYHFSRPWVPNTSCSNAKPYDSRILGEPDTGHTGQSPTYGHRIEDAVHGILSTHPEFVDFFSDPQVSQLMPDVHDAILVSVIKTLVTSKEREIIGQLRKHDGGLHLTIEAVKIAGHSKVVVQVAYEELSHRDVQMTPSDDEDDGFLIADPKAKRRHCPLVIIDTHPEASVERHLTRIIGTLEKFRIKNRLLTMTFGQSHFTNMLVSELQSTLRDIGIYTVNSYATVDSIRDGLTKNLREFREYAEVIRDAAVEILNYLKNLEKPAASKGTKRHWKNKMAANVKPEVEIRSNERLTKVNEKGNYTRKMGREGHPNGILFRTLWWDLMPILPHLRALEDFLSDARALGVTYNFNLGSNWKRLSHVLQEIQSKLRQGHIGSSTEDGQKILTTLMKKLSIFPQTCEKAILFLLTTDMSSPFTQHVVNAAKYLPKTMTTENMNNALLLKLWSKFQREEI